MQWSVRSRAASGSGAPSTRWCRSCPAAVLFDLPRGEWGNRPTASFGSAACAAAAGGPVAQGCVGAGTGAKVGSLKGGIGTASVAVDGFTVGALAAVNAAGEAVDASTGRPWAMTTRSAASWAARGRIAPACCRPPRRPA